MRLSIVLFGLLLALHSISTDSSAQTDPEDILRQAQERADQISKYRDLLSSPDQNLRVAALDVMLKSDDPAMREIAFNMAFVSADTAMRAIALRNKFLYMQTLNFSLELRENADEKEKTAIADYFANTYRLEIKKYDPNSGSIEFERSNQKGQVSGTGMSFYDKSRKCSADMVLGDGAELEGTLICSSYKNEGSYIIKLRLQ